MKPLNFDEELIEYANEPVWDDDSL